MEKRSLKPLRLVLILAAMTAAAATARAAAVPDADVAALFPENVSRAIVVVLPLSPRSHELERTVADALIRSGRVRMPVTSSVLGSIAGLSDAAVEERALRLPIDAVIIGRMHDGQLALSARYRDGTRRNPGEAMPPPPAEHAATAPATATPVAPPPPPTATPAPPTAAAAPPKPIAPPSAVEKHDLEQSRIDYDASYIDFKEQRSVAKTEPYEGRFQRLLTWPEFYSKIGRTDLAERAQTRRNWGRALLGIGVVLHVGAILGIGAQTAVNAACHDLSCIGRVDGFAAAGVFWALGVGAILGGSLMPTKVVPAWEARRLGAEYNWRLKRLLGMAQ
jgi:hypothetical protein